MVNPSEFIQKKYGSDPIVPFDACLAQKRKEERKKKEAEVVAQKMNEEGVGAEEAKEIGAVNVVQFVDGQKIGHNTDAFGFHQSIKPFLTFHHERALILGTGGASKAVAHVFRSLGIDVLFCSRDPKSRNEFPYSELNNHMINACKVIVNCTPLGTFPNVDESLELPFEHLSADHLVIDLIYNPPKSLFLQRAEECGATILNGESMLRHQALKAFEIWNS
jgi:shikimate dehydrogenase